MPSSKKSKGNSRRSEVPWPEEAMTEVPQTPTDPIIVLPQAEGHEWIRFTASGKSDRKGLLCKLCGIVVHQGGSPEAVPCKGDEKWRTT